jgi:mannose-1-phosphate guanylyltransferase
VGFTEKPDAQTAAEYLATGEYRWNAGMFIVKAQVLLDHLATQLPALADGVRELARVWDTPERDAALARVWPGLTKIAIDHAIAEPVAAAGGVAVVPGEFGWDDIVRCCRRRAARLSVTTPRCCGSTPPTRWW